MRWWCALKVKQGVIVTSKCKKYNCIQPIPSRRPCAVINTQGALIPILCIAPTRRPCAVINTQGALIRMLILSHCKYNFPYLFSCTMVAAGSLNVTLWRNLERCLTSAQMLDQLFLFLLSNYHWEKDNNTLIIFKQAATNN